MARRSMLCFGMVLAALLPCISAQTTVVVQGGSYSGTVGFGVNALYYLPAQACASTVTVVPGSGNPDLYASSNAFLTGGQDCSAAAFFCTSSASLSASESLTFNSALFPNGLYLAVASGPSPSPFAAFALSVTAQCGNAMAADSPCVSSATNCGACATPLASSCQACASGTFTSSSAGGSCAYFGALGISNNVLLLLIVVPLIAVVGVLSCCCCQGWCVARFAVFERPAIKFNACCPTYGAKYEPMDESAPNNEASHGGLPNGHPHPQQQHMQQPPTHDQYGQYERDEQYDEQEQQYDQHHQHHHPSNPYPLQQPQHQPHPQQPYTNNATMLPPPQYADAPAHAQRHSPLPPQQHYQPHAQPSSQSFSASSSSSSSSFSPGDVSLSVVPPGEDFSNTHMPPATGRLTSPAHRGHASASIGAGRTV